MALLVYMYHGEEVVGPASSVTIGPSPNIISDSITVTQPPSYVGRVEILQQELNALASIEFVTVSAIEASSNNITHCSWQVTFDSNAGDIQSLEVAAKGSNNFSTIALLDSHDVVSVTDDFVKGTSEPISGHFAILFDGERTPYLPHNITAVELTAELEKLSTIGQVQVSRFGPGVNDDFLWDVTFLTNLGELPLLKVDHLDLRGTVSTISVAKVVSGIPPPFNGPDYHATTLTDLTSLSVVAFPLKQGIDYYFRVRAINAMGVGEPTYSWPRSLRPLPYPPSKPSYVSLEQNDAYSIKIAIDQPHFDVGLPISSYRIEYSKEPFKNDKQRISLLCSPSSEIQRVTTSATDINEIQYLVLKSNYQGDGIKLERQRIQCDASGGSIGLVFQQNTVFIPYDASSRVIKEGLESIDAIKLVSVEINYGDKACIPFDGNSAGDFTVTFETLIGIDGDIPELEAIVNNLEGSRRVDISTVLQGDAPLRGSFRLSFRGSLTGKIDTSMPPENLATLIQSEIEQLDTVEHNGVLVSRQNISGSHDEMIYAIEFIGSGVGGNVLSLEIPREYTMITGSRAEVFILSDGETYYADNGVDKFVSRPGNTLMGTFQLKLGGHITEYISFNAPSEMVKQRLEALPNIGEVAVERSPPSHEMGFSWTITFIKNPSTFPSTAWNFGSLEVINALTTSVDSDASASIYVETLSDGDTQLSGSFQLAFDDGISIQRTSNIKPYFTAEALKKKLHGLTNIGELRVTRFEITNMIAWEVEFIGCRKYAGKNICNDGNIAPFEIVDVDLSGCGGVVLNVSKVESGSGAGSCIEKADGVCRDEQHVTSFPIVHTINELDVGEEYFVRVSLKNSEGYGQALESYPRSVTTVYNPPGAPPPVSLVRSSATSITISWEKPLENGGIEVSGYELWMDDWDGGKKFMVYDGSDLPDVLEYTVKTTNLGDMNQIIESGRQYQFQVRAINFCDPIDYDKACHGTFSEAQLFTVREPRRPLPPAAPKRDSYTIINTNDNSKVTVTVSWKPPVDNGGAHVSGYTLYVKASDDSVEMHSFEGHRTVASISNLNLGQVYRFYIIAINEFGRSGNSPTLTVIAGILPGQDSLDRQIYKGETYRPRITAMEKDSVSVVWMPPPPHAQGGTPISGFKLYMYENINHNSKFDPEPVRQEVQDIIIRDLSQIDGTFTVSFRGSKTDHISVNANATDIKMALQNLSTINIVSVSDISNGWRVTFDSEAGDLPLMMTTSGRLLGPVGVHVKVLEHVKGSVCRLIYDGTGIPSITSFTVNNIQADKTFAFKVAPLNAIGDGILSLASITTSTRVGASAKMTLANGSALVRGIAGFVAEEQVVTFVTNNCTSDKLMISYRGSDFVNIPCSASSHQFKNHLEMLDDMGNVHVSRNMVISSSGMSGFAWTVTFVSEKGDVPLLEVDYDVVGNGSDGSGNFGSSATFVKEFLKGASNEFTIEPKKITGEPVRDIDIATGFEGTDIFFSELWSSNCNGTSGSHEWLSDGGEATYNFVHYEKQNIIISQGTEQFQLIMDTRQSQPNGRLGGTREITVELPGIATTELMLQAALEELPNVGDVDVHLSSYFDYIQFTVTFTSIFGELPLLGATVEKVKVTRRRDQIGNTEVQVIRLSGDKSFTHEVQQISILNSSEYFSLSYANTVHTEEILCNFSDISEATALASTIESQIEKLGLFDVEVSLNITGSDVNIGFLFYIVTFLDPVGPIDLLGSDNAIVTEISKGLSYIEGSFVLSFEGQFTEDIRFDASSMEVKSALESLSTVEEVDVLRRNTKNGFDWEVSFIKSLGNLDSIDTHQHIFGVFSVDITGGNPTPLGGFFSLSIFGEITHDLPYDISSDALKDALEMLPSIRRVDVSKFSSNNGQSRWIITFRDPNSTMDIVVDTSSLSGSLDFGGSSVIVEPRNNSLIALSGNSPSLTVEEKVPGRPSYTGHYFSKATGNFCLAIMQLQVGGLEGSYFDNQWLLDSPVIERIDDVLDFNWGQGPITNYGRDYVSIRWWGKIKPKSTDLYTFYVTADEGVRVYLDHKLLIDTWSHHIMEKKGSIELIAKNFHDIRIEYKDETGTAHFRFKWSSSTLKRSLVPADVLYYVTHIHGSPFETVIVPGAADYPFSDLKPYPGFDRTRVVAGVMAKFYIQAKVRKTCYL